ncbi:hypothetical protein CVT26_005948 [Gymnopilus dilepis]|uniref:AMP-dependent synthetase/ligase domain-containing protein n=1 Tax=Gymnopilus dilepis TaxID=231916 RepID=A0A409WBX0_9AGAR|nr:hypothetical protein CVT26_005948 [Gymnopilus dilepis]
MLRNRNTLRSLASRSSSRQNYVNKFNSSRLLTTSYVEGPLEPPLSTKTLPQFFNTEILEPHSSRPALIARQERPRAHGGPASRNLGVTSHLAWDFAEFDRHIGALARGLLGMGVQKGDRVGVIMGNNSAYATLQWACANIGAILVTLNPAYRLTELAGTLNAVGVKHLFIAPRLRSSNYIRTLAEAFVEIRNAQPGELQIQDLPELRNIILVDNAEEGRDDIAKLKIRSMVDWREILMWREDVHEAKLHRKLYEGLHRDEVINLQFTSGTTGLPKAVSATSLLCSTALISVSPLSSLCKTFICFYYIRLVLGNLAAWTHGACIVYPSPSYDPPSIVDAVVAEKCTALHGVPTHFLGVLAEVEARNAEGQTVDTSSLRTGIAAGSPIPIDLMKSLIEKMNLTELTNAYGMTETSPVSFQTTPDDPLIKRVETVGKVQRHVKATLIDPQGNIVPVGKPGEICVAGYLLQKGYWNDEEQTKSAMKRDENGTLWMHTGDEGILDEEGYLRVVGRMKDIIIRGGEVSLQAFRNKYRENSPTILFQSKNLFPVQIENAMTAHPEIREAAAVAVPDDKYGEVVGAWVVREPHTTITREELRQRVARDINPQNAPAWVWFMNEDGAPEELPKTASGKVMKHILRKWSRDMVAKMLGRVGKH